MRVIMFNDVDSLNPFDPFDAQKIVGRLSDTTKMPGFSYSLPSSSCKMGNKLKKIEGSVCSKCYAHKGNYCYPMIQACLQRRLKSITNPLWAIAMSTLIEYRCKTVPYFRFHDSGDLQSVDHLLNIVTIASNLPKVKFWLPTKEYKMVDTASKLVSIPKNLVIRRSLYMINDRQENMAHANALVVVKDKIRDERYKGVHVCQATLHRHPCGKCRACWKNDIAEVAYIKH